MRPLSKRQKSVLAQLARRAFDHVADHATEAGETFDRSAAAFDAWRHDQVWLACGRTGLRACDDRNFNQVAAHLESVMGEDGRALDHLIRSSTERRRRLEVALLRELARAGWRQNYVETISLARFKKPVTLTSDEEMLDLLITVKNRARTANRRRAAEAVAACGE